MEFLCELLIWWFGVNLVLTFAMYLFWYYQRQMEPQTAQLPSGRATLNAGRVLLGIVIETLAFMLFQLCYPFSFWRDRHQPALASGSDTPILLVHGFACNSSCLWWLEWRLKRAGYRVRAVSYAPSFGNVHKLVPQIKQHIRDLLADTGSDKINYVGHSMGGVLIRDVLADPEFAAAVDKVVCLGSPQQGSRAANLLAPIVGGAIQQMVHDCDYAKSLSATPGSARWYAINSQMDNLVLPVTSAILPGMTHLTLDYLGHCSLLYSPQVAALILRCLSDNESETHE